MFLKHDARKSSSIRLVLTVVAGAAISVASLRTAPLFAQPTPDTGAVVAAQMSNTDRLAKGIDEFRKNQFEEALADLQQVTSDGLSAQNKRDLDDYLKRADSAATERKTARAEFEQGEQSLAGSRLPEASTHYRAAMNNRYADDGTKAKAKEQLAVVDAMMKQSAQSQKALYDEAVKDYHANNLDSARAKFDQLDRLGYKAGLFQENPGDYVRDIDKKLAAMPKPAPALAPMPEVVQTPPPPAPVVQSPPAPEPMPAPVVQTAPPPAPAPAPPPVAVQPTPTPPPVIVQPAPAPVVVQPEPTPAPPPAPVVTPAPAPVVVQPQPEPTPPPVPAPVVTPAPMPLPPPIPTMTASQAYHLARDQYNKGDWIAARQNFELARQLGYKPGLFEDSPERYLAKMDVKEQHDAEIAAAQARAGGQTATDQSLIAQNRAMSAQLVTQAEAARAAGRPDEALALYMRAAELDPSNTAAVAGRDSLAQTLQRTTGQPDVLTAQQVRNDQVRAYINYTFQTAIGQARQDIGQQHFDEAQSEIERARVARNINPGVFTDQELRTFDATITQTQLDKDRSVEAKRIADADAARSQAAGEIAAHQQQIDEERIRTISDLTAESRRLVNDGKYQEALGVLDQILKLDPNNDYANAVHPLVQDRAIIMEQRIYRERYDRNVVKQYTAAEEEKIPYSDIMKYPDNWPDLSAMRDRTNAIELGEKSEDQAVYAALDRKLPEVRLNNIAFSDVIEFLRDVSGANLYVNWRALETAGVDRNALVSATMKEVKFSKVLDTILKDVGGGNVTLTYTVGDGVITISTEQDLQTNVITRVYDIRDLIIDVEDFTQPPTFNLQSSAGGGRGGGGGGNLFANAGQQATTVTRQALVDQMITLIQDTVATDSWQQRTGTGPGTIRNLPSTAQLIVTQTPENHRKLRLLLDQLRETRAIQITIETRFLTVQRNFLEEVGVDFDFLVNPNGQLFSQVSPIGVQNNSSAFTSIANLQTGIPGSIASDLAASSSGSTGVTPNFSVTNGPLGTSGGAVTFLDDFQVSLLLRATQISQNTTTLTAPRLTLFNGQRAFVVVSTSTAYVSDVTPVIATGAVAFDPTITNAQSGVLLDVQATVSADRKYVTLTLRPILSRLRSLVSFPVSAVVNTGVVGTGGATGSTQITSATIQEPVIDNTIINTTVSVPDGGTLLLGGQTLAGEIELESGVPILSKIPFLKRLFTNSSMAKDEQILLILVKPTIIIQREKEQEQFPLLNSQRAG